MQSTSPPSPLHPALLPAGTQVGPWRVVDWAGQGVHGAVYRAVRIGLEHLPPVALKLALLPDDPRFTRERELLSRTLHPHIPRLVDHGHWQGPSGSLHPYIAMEWVDGVPLYDWARLFRPSAAQQLRLLAQVAFTLHYLHTQGAFHRDLKGGNLLVCRSDSRLFLTDFGSGIYPDADTLTPQQLPPGTPAYRSRSPWLALAVAAGALATWAGWMTRAAFPQPPEVPPPASEAAPSTARNGAPEVEHVGLGEAAASTPAPSPSPPSTSEPLAENTPPEPFEGQAQPDKKGRCPNPQQVIFNGSCWGRITGGPQECEVAGGQMYRGTCYVPIFPRGSKRPTTSGPGTPR